MKAVVAGVVVAAAVSGCGGAGTATSTRATDPSASATTTTTVGKHVEQGSGHLRMTIRPTSGPVGTVVHISATGCSDADGQNHAVSFNPGFGNTLQAARAHYQQGVIDSHLSGQVLHATYRITTQDARAAEHADASAPLFYVQCATDLADLPFTITK